MEFVPEAVRLRTGGSAKPNNKEVGYQIQFTALHCWVDLGVDSEVIFCYKKFLHREKEMIQQQALAQT